MPPKNSAWIVRPRVRDNARLRLFCFPHAGAGSVIFRDWHNDFPDTVDVCLVEPPGRLARRHEPSAASVQEFATAFDAALPPLLDLPIALFGYSLGALMAFEWARTLRRDHGLDVKSLIVAAAKAPQSPRRLPVITHEPEPIFLRELERRYGALEPALKAEPELLHLILQIMRKDLRTVDDYRYDVEAPLACPIVSVGGSDDASITPDEIAAWAAQTAGAFQTSSLPGGHFFIRNSAPRLRALIREAIAPLI